MSITHRTTDGTDGQRRSWHGENDIEILSAWRGHEVVHLAPGPRPRTMSLDEAADLIEALVEATLWASPTPIDEPTG